MFKENKDFYPTPPNLTHKMLKDIKWAYVKSVLEPSAGSGHLVEEIHNKLNSSRGYYNKSKSYDIDLIELDENLRHILKGKGHRVIHDDFLTFSTCKQYDVIIANVPYSQGDKHLHKILDLIEDGGQARILCNAETIRNPYSNIRKSLIVRLEELGAEIEFIKDGFKNAERSTNVEVALIKVDIDKKENKSIIIDRLKQEEQLNKTHVEYNTLVEGDFLTSIVKRYDFEVKAGLNLINEYKSLSPILTTDVKGSSSSIIELKLYGDQYSNDSSTIQNKFIKLVRNKYWSALFANDKFTSLLTTKLLEQYRGKIKELEDYDFSLYNIKEIQNQMNINLSQGIEDSIMRLFDEFTSKHSMEEFSKNIHLFNGWKSNKCYKVSNKVITTISSVDRWSNKLDYGGSFFNKIRDIERVFDYLDGGRTNNFDDLKEILNKAQENRQNKNIECKYFTLNCFYKGTTHIKFKNEELLHAFNVFGAKNKQWLPPSYGKSTYEEMSKDEQNIIDSFEGKESYNKVMQNADYYLYNPNQVLLLN